MANTKIPSELSSTPSISDSGNATAITIDSSERVSIGHTTANADFQVSNAGAEQIEFYAGNGSDLNATQHYNRTNSQYVDNKVIANTHQFFSGANEKLRITGKKMLVTGGETLNTNWGTEFNGIQMGDTHIAGYAGSQSSARTLFLGANNVWSDANYYRPTSGYSTQLVINTSVGNVDVKTWGTGSAGQLSSGTTRFRVQQTGEVLAPTQPHIFGSLTNTGGSGIANTYTDHAASSRSNLTVNTVSGQKRFTASVTGVYLVSITTIMDQTSVRKDTAIYHNGTKIGQTLNDEATGFHYRCWTHTIEMAANDYILVESDDWYDATGTTSTVWRRISMTLLS